MSETQIEKIKLLNKKFNDLIKEFLVDLKSIDCGINDYGDNLADGDQLDKIIEKWERRLKDGS